LNQAGNGGVGGPPIIGPTSGESQHQPGEHGTLAGMIGTVNGGGPEMDIDDTDPDITEAADLAIKKVDMGYGCGDNILR